MEKKIIQEVSSDWKPVACSSCSSFSHNNSTCPLQPSKAIPSRGRSRSRGWGRPNASPRHTKAQTTPLSLPARTSLPPAHPPANSTALPAEPNHSALPLKAPTALLNDLNQLPVSSPPPETNAEPVIAIASSESTDSDPPPSIPSATADVNTPSSAYVLVTTAQSGHPHALRSLDKALASPNVDQHASTTDTTSNSPLTQNKGKKKGKK